ncbi:MAG: ABC transporter ATP-binding protein [Leptospiraceae bacterium]|nr:ABC transporter ATP-binding protein [Leptospiraceae bacterium]
MNIAIESNNLTKRYSGTIALKSLSLEISEGEIFGFLGQNGAGKTTFIKILLGMCKPSNGEVKIFGDKVSTKTKALIGYLPEKISIPGFLRAREFLSFCGRLSGMSGILLQKKIEEVLEIVELKSHSEERTVGFSKGMIQRLGIAQAILHEPKILLLDEPASGLDPKGIIDLRNIILKANSNYKTTIFLNSHRLLEAEKICTRVGILQKGLLVANGKLDELTRSKNQIKLELSEFNESLKSLIENISNVFHFPSNNSAVFEPKEDVELKGIPAMIVEQGGDIIKYERAIENLEEIFLRLTDGGEKNV